MQMSQEFSNKNSAAPISQKAQAFLDELTKGLLDIEKKYYKEDEKKKPFTEHAALLCKQLQKDFQNMYERIAQAKKIFHDYLEIQDSHSMGTHYLKEWDSLLQNLQSKIDAANFSKNLGANQSLQEICAIPWHFMERLYSLAHQFLLEQRFTEAESLYAFLRILKPQISEYWLGEATCQHAQGRVDEAQVGYIIALGFDPKNPLAFLQIARCLIAQNEPKAAIQALNTSIEYASENKDNFQVILQDAKELKKALENQ